jgi:hypothetical protein
VSTVRDRADPANSLLIADITSLQWRAFANGAVNLPYVVNAFVAGFISAGISAYSANGWRWGYGMFCIMLPVCMAPALAVLFIGDHRAKKLGMTSTLRDAAPEVETRTVWETVKFYWTRLNVTGLLLMGFGFALLLTPITLSTTAKGGYKNRECWSLDYADNSLPHRHARGRWYPLHRLVRVGQLLCRLPLHASPRVQPDLCRVCHDRLLLLLVELPHRHLLHLVGVRDCRLECE